MTNRLVAQVPAEGYPFRVLHIFFLSVHIERAPKIGGPVQGLPLAVEVSYSPPEPNEPYKIALRFRSERSESQLTTIEVVVIGLFEHEGEGKPTDKELNSFINSFLLAAMSARAIQLIGSLTAEMGMPPVWVDMPRGFGLDVSSVVPDARTNRSDVGGVVKDIATDQDQPEPQPPTQTDAIG